MPTAKDPIATITDPLRDALHKTADLMDSDHLHSLGKSGHEAASRLLASAPDLTSRLGSPPVDVGLLRSATARRAHQLAHSIDDGAEALAPTTTGGHRWRRRLFVLALAGAAAVYFSRKLAQGKASRQGEIEPTVEIAHNGAIAEESSTRTSPGKLAEGMKDPPRPMNGARANKVKAQ